MNDEIKEILDKWKCYIGLTKKYTTNEYEMLRVEDIDKILDYITNLQQEYERIYNENCKLREQHNITDINLLDENYRLQQENERLKEWKKDLLNENIELENIRKEAIEYINKHPVNACHNLLNILQNGSDSQ